jgi:hypothetical protein
MQQQEITRRVEFRLESAAGRGLRNRPYTAMRQAKITMVRPICESAPSTSVDQHLRLNRQSAIAQNR